MNDHEPGDFTRRIINQMLDELNRQMRFELSRAMGVPPDVINSTATSTQQSTLDAAAFERALRTMQELTRPAFDTIVVVPYLVPQPYLIHSPMDGKTYLYIDRGMWSQVASHVQANKSEYPQLLGIPVIFAPVPETPEKDDKTP